MVIKMIMCTDAFGALGYKGDLIYKISDDLKRFKQLTKGSICVMGRKTLESLPQQYLPERINVVLTSDKNYKPKNSNVIVMHDFDSIINHYENGTQDKDIFIIGGEKIYHLFYDHAQIIHLTKVLDVAKQWDIEIDIGEFENKEYFVQYSCFTKKDQESNLYYQFIDYVRHDYLDILFEKNTASPSY